MQIPGRLIKITVIVIAIGVLAALSVAWALPSAPAIVKLDQVIALPTPVPTPTPSPETDQDPDSAGVLTSAQPDPSNAAQGKTTPRPSAALKVSPTPSPVTPKPKKTAASTPKPSSTVKTKAKVEEKKKTPLWGKYTRQEYILLSTLIYFEASPSANLEAACAVGWVVRNRSESKSWGKQGIEKTIYRAGQFSVVKSNAFEKMLKQIDGLRTNRAYTARKAASYVLQGQEKHRLPSDVQYFHGDGGKREWGGHEFYKEIGGNAFFKR